MHVFARALLDSKLRAASPSASFMTRIFIHSWHGDFARTEIASEIESPGPAVGQGHAPLKLFACGCDGTRLMRIRRPLWMRVVLTFRLYRCLRCGARVFRRRRDRGGYPAM